MHGYDARLGLGTTLTINHMVDITPKRINSNLLEGRQLASHLFSR